MSHCLKRKDSPGPSLPDQELSNQASISSSATDFLASGKSLSLFVHHPLQLPKESALLWRMLRAAAGEGLSHPELAEGHGTPGQIDCPKIKRLLKICLECVRFNNERRVFLSAGSDNVEYLNIGLRISSFLLGFWSRRGASGGSVGCPDVPATLTSRPHSHTLWL